MSTITGLLIAKDEEAVVENALKSLAFCDEIIFVDTGSTDKTVEIAKKYTDKIFHFEWINDFSAARNYALDQATQDWCLFIDCDDIIEEESQKKIREFTETAKSDVVGAFINYMMLSGDKMLSPKLFKNKGSIRYVEPIHEYLNISKIQIKSYVVKENILLLHTRKEHLSSAKRNLIILRKHFSLNPENYRLGFYLGRDLMVINQFLEAIDILKEVLKNDKLDKQFLYRINYYIGLSYHNIKQYNQAILYYELADKVGVKFNEPLIHIADIYFMKNQYEKAAKFYRKALTYDLPQSGLEIKQNFYYDYPKRKLKLLSNIDKPLIVIIGVFGRSNFGDEIILKAVLDNLLDFRIVIISSYNIVMIEKMFLVETVKSDDIDRIKNYLKDAEALIIVGNDLNFIDKNNRGVLDDYLSIYELANGYQLKKIILGASVGNLSSPEEKNKIDTLLNNTDHIFFSNDAYKGLIDEDRILGEKIKVIPSLLFGLIYPKIPVNENKIKPTIGLNIEGGYKNEELYSDCVINFINSNSLKYDLNFIPVSKDDFDGKELLENLTNLKIHEFKINLLAIIKLIVDSDFIIASDIRIIIVSIILGKPVYYLKRTIYISEDILNYTKSFKGKITNLRVISPAQLKILHLKVKRTFDYLDSLLSN